MDESIVSTNGNKSEAKENGHTPRNSPGQKKEVPNMPFPLIVIGASSGGLEAIKKVMAGLPKNLGAAVFIVWHMAPDVRGILPYILNKYETLYAAHAFDGEEITANRIYVAPPDHHMLIEGSKLRVSKGPKENHFRPAVDPLFRSAAFYYGTHVIGVILSGALDDGTSGLYSIKENGGIAIIQDPFDAEVPSMPESAARHVNIDYSVPVAELPNLLIRLLKEKAMKMPVLVMKNDNNADLEIRIAGGEAGFEESVMKLGELSPFACPECHGVLTAINEGTLKRYRCHTGHAFSIDTLLTVMTEHIEDILWSAIRSIKETTILLNTIGDHYAGSNNPKLAGLYFRKAQEAEQRAIVVKSVVTYHEQ